MIMTATPSYFAAKGGCHLKFYVTLPSPNQLAPPRKAVHMMVLRAWVVAVLLIALGASSPLVAIARTEQAPARLDRPNRFVPAVSLNRVIHSSFPPAGSRHPPVAEALDPSAPAVYDNETW